jgi:hypothetical protein
VIRLHDHDTPGRHPAPSANGTATATPPCTCPADRAEAPAADPRPAAPASSDPPDLSPKQRAVADALRIAGVPLKATQIAARAGLEYDGNFRGTVKQLKRMGLVAADPADPRRYCLAAPGAPPEAPAPNRGVTRPLADLLRGLLHLLAGVADDGGDIDFTLTRDGRRLTVRFGPAAGAAPETTSTVEEVTPPASPAAPPGPLSKYEREVYTLLLENDRRMIQDEITEELCHKRDVCSERTVHTAIASLIARGMVNNQRGAAGVRGYGIVPPAE